MAASYQNQAVTGLLPAAEAFELARAAASRAIEIDPEYAPAYDSLGFLAQYYQPDLTAAARYYQRALQLAPRDAGIIGSAGILLQTLGRAEEGLPLIEYTTTADPLSAGWHYTLGLAYMSAERNPQAVSSFETVLSLSPDFSLAYYSLGVALMLDGRPGEAVAALQKEERESWRLIGMSMALFALEQTSNETATSPTAAELALAELVQKHGEQSTYNIAYVYAFRNEPDAAFLWLDKAMKSGDPGMGEVLSQPLLKNLHNDPRWIALLTTLDKAPEQLAEIILEAPLPEQASKLRNR